MRILINDANILIDLAKLELLQVFGDLTFDLFTTDFVLEELNNAQRNPVSALIANGKLTVIETFEASDFKGITTILEKSRGLSFEDCSVFITAKKCWERY